MYVLLESRYIDNKVQVSTYRRDAGGLRPGFGGSVLEARRSAFLGGTPFMAADRFLANQGERFHAEQVGDMRSDFADRWGSGSVIILGGYRLAEDEDRGWSLLRN